MLFHLLSKLYEQTSAIITANLSFSEWDGLFGGAKMSSALLDRLAHHRRIVEIGNDIFCFCFRVRSEADTAHEKAATRPAAPRA